MKRINSYESGNDDTLVENAYRAEELLLPLLTSPHFSLMLKAFWVICDPPHQLPLQTDYLVFERLHICQSEYKLVEGDSE